ncbi:peptidoglycan O-acetyltransferase [Holospora undulata HU1]|uniref:Probable alginate O-acetylase AlgI n=1 Tax=Holospora undulata HU1 TaxID=1321371 RepID=A0A061JFR1_9PROT|nr:peptidoglycan O-acetyltransferase [Holospora undulata HU1]ETZ04460.1 peptidoglycan O-acetyltransferase [Holospora undulata HU1]ETZ04497.1 peptidoglycan O-acetyltransferase [Holospora undulata HU1]
MPILTGMYRFSVCFNQIVPKLVLCLASIVFYSFMALEYLPLMLISITANYLLGSVIDRTRKKVWLISGVVFNLSLIFFFKYYDLVFIHTLKITSIHWNDIIPLGISFYTFTQIAYLVDTWNGKAHKDKSFISYFLFVTYFPHLIAGPILHHKDMLAQFADKTLYRTDYKNIFQGLIFFVTGLSKKILLADNLIPYVKPVFQAVAQGEHVYPLECWCGILAYSFQLYFDFSGYSDMAIGISKFFNFDLPKNFASPYKAFNIIEFWRRWHMSLSAFLRDYLYIPLGGNRKGKLRRHANLIITMAIGGMWHGANWTFLFWGLYHGLLLVANHLLSSTRKISRSMGGGKVGFTFFLVLLGWVLFRSESLSAAISYYKYLFNVQELFIIPDGWKNLEQKLPFPVSPMPYFFGKSEIAFIAMCAVIAFFFPNSQETVEKHGNPRMWILISLFLTFLVCLYKMDDLSEFIYFQF